MLHPVGRLPARVYWRRRLVLLAVLLGLLAGGGWLTLRLLDPAGTGASAGAATSAARPVPTPALEQPLPSLAGVRTPGSPGPEAGRTPTPTPSPAGPTPGGPCTDEMVDLVLRAPTTATAGSEVRIELVVRNVAEVPCERRLDAELQEVRLADADGDRVWGSNDCLQEGGRRTATLEPGEDVVLPVVWSGRTSEPTCTQARSAPSPGVYVLRGSLADETTPTRRIRLL